MLTMIMMIVWLDGVHLMCVHYLNFKYLCRFSFFPLIYPPPHLVEPFHPFTATPKALDIYSLYSLVGWLAGYALIFFTCTLVYASPENIYIHFPLTQFFPFLPILPSSILCIVK